MITVNSPLQPYTKDIMEFDLFPTPRADHFEPTPVVQQEPVQECRYPLRSSRHPPLRCQPGLSHLIGECDILSTLLKSLTLTFCL